MSVPPQGGWQPQQPGGPPPYGPPPAGYPQYSGQQPPGFPQGPWPQQPPPPPKGNSTKWLLIAIALLLVVGVSIGATLLFTRDGGDGPSNPPTSGVPSDIASANDTGPVSIITEEPTCKAFTAINNSLGDVQRNGWSEQRASLGAAAEWTPEQRTQVEAVATALVNSADQMVALARQTPHRVVRELYEQFIAYARAYRDSIPEYTPADDALAQANVNASAAIYGICQSIDTGSASRSISIPPAPEPTSPVVAPSDLEDPQRFITEANQSCDDWDERLVEVRAGTADWDKLDSAIPASQWTPERRAAEQSVQPILAKFADDMEAAGRSSGNPTFEDFASTAAIYFRAYLAVGDSYTGADSWLSYVPFRLANVISGACRAT